MNIKELEEIIIQLKVGQRIDMPSGLTVKRAQGMAATIGARNNMLFWVFSALDYKKRKK